jgi:hypothetical protein
VQDDAHIFCREDQITPEGVDFCALLASVYRDPAFVRYAAPPSQPARVFRVALDPAETRAAVAESVYLQRVFTGSAGPR